MFQGGLLATFIPEIIMVVAYLMCLLSPGIKNAIGTSENPNKQICIATSDFKEISPLHSISFHSPIVNNHRIDIEVVHPRPLFVIYYKKVGKSFENIVFLLPDGLSYYLFSRPPPILLS